MLARVAVLAVLVALSTACSGSREPLQPGGNVVPGTTSDGLTYRAETRVFSEPFLRIETTVTLTNASDSAQHIVGELCPVLLRAYRTPDRSGPPAWDPPEPEVCPLINYEWTLALGESAKFDPAQASALLILGESNPPGRYYFTAVVRLKDRPVVEIPAGDAELR